jgi:hypothetical protein
MLLRRRRHGGGFFLAHYIQFDHLLFWDFFSRDSVSKGRIPIEKGQNQCRIVNVFLTRRKRYLNDSMGRSCTLGMREKSSYQH